MSRNCSQRIILSVNSKIKCRTFTDADSSLKSDMRACSKRPEASLLASKVRGFCDVESTRKVEQLLEDKEETIVSLRQQIDQDRVSGDARLKH